MQVVLVMFRSDGERRSFSVVRNLTVIGRREDCDLRIPVGEVSRKHCRLVRTDDGIRIEDLGSSNGTWVNGDRVQENDLNPGDVVTVGPVQFVVQIDGVPADDQLVPPASLTGSAIDDDDSMMGYTPPPASLEQSHDDLTIDEASAPQEATDDEFQILESPTTAAQPAAEEFALEGELAAGGEALVGDDFSFDEEPVTPAADELDLAEDSTIPAEQNDDIEITSQTSPPVNTADDLDLPAFPAAAAPGEDEFVIPDLETSPDATAATPNKGSEDPADSDWDFDIEETDPQKTSPDFNIDLDSSHQQPHK